MQKWLTMLIIGRGFNILSESKETKQAVRKTLNSPIEVDENQPGNPNFDQQLLTYSIEFRNVSFTYPGANAPVIENLSFIVNPAKSMGIVGSTSVGKSTIIRLMLGLYTNYEGAILLNGIDIRTISKNSLRSIIGVVPQDVVLFRSENLVYNVKYGKPVRTYDEAHTIDEESQAAINTSLISTLPTDQPVSFFNPSGGAVKRIGIARQIYHGSKVNVYDEPIAGLDASTAATLLNEFNNISTGKTTLIVTHRVTIVKNADAILFLNKTENGFESHCDTFDNLMEIDSFRDMYQAQTEQAYEHLFQSPRA